MHRDLLAFMIAAAAAGACAHSEPKPPGDTYVVNTVQRFGAWFERIPRCAPTKKATTDLASLQPDEEPMAIAVRGRLTFAAKPACTVKACSGECCNNCSPRWVVVPEEGDAPRRELAVQRAGEEHPLSAAVQDCKLAAVREQLPKSPVIVTGFLDDDAFGRKIIRASICVVQEPTPPPVP